MAQFSFAVPTQFGGKSLKQIREADNLAFRPDIIAEAFGRVQEEPLKAGEILTLGQKFRNPSFGTSGESQFIRKHFQPAEEFRAQQAEAQRVAFATEQREREEAERLRRQQEEEAFLGKFRTEFPAAIQAIQEELNLPALRQTAQAETQRLEDLPGALTAEAAGRDISAEQLQRAIAAETGKLAPEARRAVEQAQFAQQQFGERVGQALVPLEQESQFLTERLGREFTGLRESLAREFSGFTQQAENEFNLLLQKIQQEGTMDQLEFQRATSLAEIEAAKDQAAEQGRFTDLGDKVALIDPSSGSVIGEFAKGLSPQRQAGGGGRVGTLAEQWEIV